MATLTLDVTAQIAAADKDVLLEQARVQGFSTVEALVMSVINRIRDTPLTDRISFDSEKIADENGNIRLNYTGVIGARWEDEEGNIYLAIENGDIVKILPAKG